MSGRTLGWTAGALVTAVLLGGLAWGLGHPAVPGHPSLVGRPAPELTVRTLEGDLVNLSSLRGSPVVLNFWASWCGPCRLEEGPLRQSATDLAGSVRFLGVDIQDTLEGARAAQARAAYPYPVGPPAGSVPAEFGVRAPPTTFFINAGGIVVARFTGPLDGSVLERYLQLARSGAGG